MSTWKYPLASNWWQ